MKKFLAWRNDWLTVIDVMNTQHKAIADDINGLAETYLEECDVGPGGLKLERVMELMDHLYMLTEQHFEFEEQLMASSGYPELEAHRQEHRMMLSELKHYRKQITDDIESINIDVLMSLKRWFVDHVMESDKALAGFVSTRWEDKRRALS